MGLGESEQQNPRLFSKAAVATLYLSVSSGETADLLAEATFP